MKIALARLKIDESLSPRKRLDAKHVDEFVELAGEWPPVLARPISHNWYTHQLVGGFHRAAAAEKLGYSEIEARVEVMDDDTALLRACQDNATHGLPLTREEKRAWVVMLRNRGVTQQRIASDSGITQGLVAQYLSAERVNEVIININNDLPAPNLTLPQAAALGRLVDNPDDKRRASPGPRLVEDPKREAARAQVPSIARVAAEKKLPPATVSALADAALAEPELAADLIKRVETETLQPEAIRTAAKTIADPEQPIEVKRHNVTPGALIQTRDGVSMADIGRVMAKATAQTPDARALPVDLFLKRLDGYRAITDDALTCWLDLAEPEDLDLAGESLDRVCEWAAHVKNLIAQHRKQGLRVVR